MQSSEGFVTHTLSFLFHVSKFDVRSLTACILASWVYKHGAPFGLEDHISGCRKEGNGVHPWQSELDVAVHG